MEQGEYEGQEDTSIDESEGTPESELETPEEELRSEDNIFNNEIDEEPRETFSPTNSRR